MLKRKLVPYLIAPFGFGVGFTLILFSILWGCIGTIHAWMIAFAIGLFLIIYATVVAINWSIKR